MYHTALFAHIGAARELEDFLNSNGIKKEQIVSISMAISDDAIERAYGMGKERILLVYEDG